MLSKNLNVNSQIPHQPSLQAVVIEVIHVGNMGSDALRIMGDIE